MARGSAASSTPSDPERQRRDDAAERIDHRGNAGIGRAHQRQAFAIAQHARLLEMLVGPGADAEPAVIGQIDQPARPLAARHRCAGEDRFVADQRQHLRRARHVHGAPAVAGDKSADHAW